MRKSMQWALILTLSFALALAAAPGGIAHSNEGGNGGDDDDDDGSGGDNGGCDCDDPGGNTEFVVGSYKCDTQATLTFAGSLGVGSFQVTHPGSSDPNSSGAFDSDSCGMLGESIENTATTAGCTSSGLVSPPDPAPTTLTSTMLSFICVGKRNEIVRTMGSLITEFVTFVPSGPMLLPTAPQSGPIQTRGGGRRR